VEKYEVLYDGKGPFVVICEGEELGEAVRKLGNTLDPEWSVADYTAILANGRGGSGTIYRTLNSYRKRR